MARASQEQEREKAIAAVKSLGISQSAEVTPRERSRGREPEKERPSPVTTQQPELSSDEIDKKTKAILDEYLHIQDMKEAVTCVKELPPANHANFCANALNHVLERSEVARRQTGHLLHDLVKNSIITVDSYIKGLLEVLEFAEDMEIDIPKIWMYLGELVGQMIQDGSVPLSFLKQAAKPLVASNKAGIFVAEVLHDASHREGHKKLAELWQSSGLQWTDFLPKNQIDQFLVDKKLEFTKGGDSVPTTPTTGLPMVTIEEELNRLVVVEKRDNETVFDWIESNVDEPTTKRWKFIRALMTCVCNSAFLGEGSNIRVDPKEVSKRHDLLQKYLDHQAESELQALYALQALVTKLEHPPGVLRQMFDTLYDEDIISEDAFLQWEKSDEEPGKGVAMKQVVQFFTWLREAEDDNDS